ncbi:MAG: DUF481 domain-containing protein [Ferruginibacter sp.]|nr:DUF481 domain-containing protein [Ferruginibacter sp.]
MKLTAIILITLFYKEPTVYGQSYIGKAGTLTIVNKDSFKLRGNISVTGLIQTGNENRTVVSLLSLISLGNSQYQVEPLTSIAYSTKPGRQVEGEYLENIVVRYQQKKLFYPAAGFSFEKSLLRKIDYRWSSAILIIFNLLQKDDQLIKAGIGYNHDFTRFVSGAFNGSTIANKIGYRQNSDQLYLRLKGKNNFFKNNFILSYDFYYQPSFSNFNDYRWTLISNLDIPVTKLVDLRANLLSSYDSLVATSIAKYNFRLTYGISIKF